VDCFEIILEYPYDTDEFETTLVHLQDEQVFDLQPLIKYVILRYCNGYQKACLVLLLPT